MSQSTYALPEELAHLRGELDRHFEPTLLLPETQDPGRSCVQLGGEPRLAPTVDWPLLGGVPACFVAELDFDALARVDADSRFSLPRHGVLTFFLDLHTARAQRRILRGNAPEQFALRYCPTVQSAVRRPSPTPEASLPVVYLEAREHADLGDCRDSRLQAWDWDEMIADANGDELSLMERYQDLDAVVRPGNKIGGHCYICQSDPRAPLPGDPDDWVLLLQLLYRAEFGIDVGGLSSSVLTWWGRRRSLESGVFDEVRLAWSLP